MFCVCPGVTVRCAICVCGECLSAALRRGKMDSRRVAFFAFAKRGAQCPWRESAFGPHALKRGSSVFSLKNGLHVCRLSANEQGRAPLGNRCAGFAADAPFHGVAHQGKEKKRFAPMRASDIAARIAEKKVPGRHHLSMQAGKWDDRLSDIELERALRLRSADSAGVFWVFAWKKEHPRGQSTPLDALFFWTV